MHIDLDSGVLTDLNPEKQRESYIAVVEGVSEDEAYNALSGIKEFDDTAVTLSTLNPEEQTGIPYTEKLAKYEKEGLDDTWPMVAILYSSVPGVPGRSMDINEAVDFISGLDAECDPCRMDFLRISISYTKEDWQHEHLELIELGEDRSSFIDTLKLPPSDIQYLNNHNNVLGYMKEACNYAPDTHYGRDFADRAMEWAQCCRMELNHSREPVLPAKPALGDEMLQRMDFDYWTKSDYMSER